jgi:hypothetical protein
MDRVRLSVDIDPATKHRLAVLAALRKTTISNIVVEAVRRTLSEDERVGTDGDTTSAAGVLARYADTERRKREEGTWMRRVVETAAERENE